MERFLLSLGGLTLGGSAAILLLALAGRSTRARYGARWRCWGWVLLCLRLAVPIPLLPAGQADAPIRVPVPPAAVQPDRPVRPVTPVTPPQTGPGTSAAPDLSAPLPAGSDSPSVQEPELPAEGTSSPLPLLLLTWLGGAAAVLIWNTAAHLRFLAYLRRWSSPVGDSGAVSAFNRIGDQLHLDRRPRLLVCQGLKVPMLAGLLSPALLLPPGKLAGQELAYSLLHELTHFRRRDIWLKSLALWVKALFWFNPLSWLMVRLIERDTELACDEAALALLPPEDHGAYGQTILTAVSRLQTAAAP